MEAAGRAYYNPTDPHQVYMPMVRSPLSLYLTISLSLYYYYDYNKYTVTNIPPSNTFFY